MENYIPPKLARQRGFVFAQLDKDLSEKYHLSRLIIGYIRRESLYKKKSRQDICISITNALQTDVYKTIETPPKGYRNPQDFIQDRIKTLEFLLKCSQEIYDDITRLTKWDWDYIGDDRKVPSREEINILRQQSITNRQA